MEFRWKRCVYLPTKTMQKVFNFIENNQHFSEKLVKY